MSLFLRLIGILIWIVSAAQILGVGFLVILMFYCIFKIWRGEHD